MILLSFNIGLNDHLFMDVNFLELFVSVELTFILTCYSFVEGLTSSEISKY